MSKKPFPVFCLDCKHQKPEPGSDWNLRCHHPRVNAQDAWALGGAKMNGTSCTEERKHIWFRPCGQHGKLWELA